MPNFSSEHERDFFDAVRTGNIKTVKALLSVYDNPNVDITGISNKKPTTPLRMAIRAGNVEMVKILIQAGANVDLMDERGITPLISAICHKKLEIASILLENGADPNKICFYCYTPLTYVLERVCQNMRLAIDFIEILLSFGADTRLRDGAGREPYGYATEHRHNGIIEIMDTVEQNLISSLIFTVRSGNIRAVESLLFNSRVNFAAIPCREVMPPLVIAVKQNKLKIMKMLLRANFDPNSYFDGIHKIIHEAVKRQNKEMVKMLLDYGADVNDIAFQGHMGYEATPLGLAIENGNIEIIRLLLDHGANPNSVESRNVGGCRTTPLKLALTSENIRIIRLLFDYGANFTSYSGMYTDDEMATLIKYEQEFMQGKALALAKALHPRLGAASPLSLADSFIIRDILCISRANYAPLPPPSPASAPAPAPSPAPAPAPADALRRRRGQAPGREDI